MKLYKYLDPKTAPVLENLCIRFTQAAEFNDPFELSPPLEAVFPPGEAANIIATLFPENWGQEAAASVLNDPEVQRYRAMVDAVGGQELWNRLESYLRAAMDLFQGNPEGSLESMLPTFRDHLPLFRARLNTQFGMLCLAQDPDCLLMWAHYADSHRGVVLEFDSTHRFFDQRESPTEAIRYLREVAYSDHRPGFTLFDAAADPENALSRMAAAFFLTKASKWSYEREWRMIVPVTQDDPEARAIHLFLLPEDCLTALIFGIRTPQAEKDRLISLLQDRRWFKDIELRQAVQDEREFRIRIESYGP